MEKEQQQEDKKKTMRRGSAAEGGKGTLPSFNLQNKKEREGRE